MILDPEETKIKVKKYWYLLLLFLSRVVLSSLVHWKGGTPFTKCPNQYPNSCILDCKWPTLLLSQASSSSSSSSDCSMKLTWLVKLMNDSPSAPPKKLSCSASWQNGQSIKWTVYCYFQSCINSMVPKLSSKSHDGSGPPILSWFFMADEIYKAYIMLCHKID